MVPAFSRLLLLAKVPFGKDSASATLSHRTVDSESGRGRNTMNKRFTTLTNALKLKSQQDGTICSGMGHVQILLQWLERERSGHCFVESFWC